jgi:hypothetical protein
MWKILPSLNALYHLTLSITKVPTSPVKNEGNNLTTNLAFYEQPVNTGFSMIYIFHQSCVVCEQSSLHVPERGCGMRMRSQKEGQALHPCAS